MSDPLVLVESRPDGVTLLRLNRPPLNPLSTALLRELEGIATGLAADASVKAVVVTGSEKAFAASSPPTAPRRSSAPASAPGSTHSRRSRAR
jgi:enoyl-CoA hydratase/carnithine racemase